MRTFHFTTLLGAASTSLAITLDVTSKDSIKSAASQIAYDMMSFYTGNKTGDTPGNLPAPYYWWEAGAMFGAMIDYWHYTGDASYNEVITQALLHQANSPDNDFKPRNQSKSLGNDDQGFWGFAAMAAAETNFPNPPSTSPQWLALAQAVFNTQAVQYDVPPATCGGGLRWQIFSFNSGYTYKNAISNGCFFNLGARLARYTNNATYFDWAEKTYQWMEDIGMITENLEVFDGTDETKNCSDFDHNRWTYNVGVFLLGAANMYNYSASIDESSSATALWRSRTSSLMNATNVFFTDDGATPSAGGVMTEFCELSGNCKVDQRSFKAYLARWMAASTKVAPFLYDSVKERLETSATAAANQCSGGSNGRMCGQKWFMDGNWDGNTGVGEQMCALEIIQGNLITDTKGPLTTDTGGTSPGDTTAGVNTSTSTSLVDDTVITTGSKVGAGILTAVVLSGVIGAIFMMCV